MIALLSLISLRIILPLIITLMAVYIVLRLLGRHKISHWPAWVILLAAALFPVWVTATSTAIVRFTEGIGPVSGMNDNFPWGIWIGFDMMVGVALAAGGFVTAGLVHVFNIKQFHGMLRAAILTAFLGYLLVVGGLIFDLGRPYRIWHPLVYWQHHSVMFELGWCVSMYTTVLALEFSPMVLEKLPFKWPLKIIKFLTPVFVILGITLSTLHQSSLGSLYVLMPEKLHPLWWTPALPVLFFISAVAVGPAMVTVENLISGKLAHHKPNTKILSKLGGLSGAVLAVYLALRLADLTSRSAWSYAFEPTLIAFSFWLEILLGAVVPIILLGIPRLQFKLSNIATVAGLIVGGVVLNRLNVAIFGMLTYTGPAYAPTLRELSVTITLVSLGVATFALAVRYLAVFPTHTEEQPQLKPTWSDTRLKSRPVEASPVRNITVSVEE